MWKRRKEDTPFERTSEPPVRPFGGAPSVPPPAAAAAPRVTRAEATIGKSVLIKGQLYSEEDLHLDGQIEGTLELPKSRFTVGKSGKVQASIKAREVDVQGTVHGNIEALEKITIRSAANLVGDLRSATISIEDGAYFKGSIDIVRPAPTKAPAPPPAPAPAAPRAQPPASSASAASATGNKPPSRGPRGG